MLNYLGLLRRELAAFAECLTGDLDTPVAHCGDWTLYDLVDHLGGGNLWAAAAVTQGHGDLDPPPGPRDPSELARWFDSTSQVLLAVLSADPHTPAWTFFPPHTVGFWRRRRTQETLMHRWDAEHALGKRPVLDPEPATDGIAEVVDTMAPRMVKRGVATAPEQAVRFATTDTGASLVFGPGEPVATLTGTASELLLMLWGRRHAESAEIDWSGDRAAARTVLKGPLTP